MQYFHFVAETPENFFFINSCREALVFHDSYTVSVTRTVLEFVKGSDNTSLQMLSVETIGLCKLNLHKTEAKSTLANSNYMYVNFQRFKVLWVCQARLEIRL